MALGDTTELLSRIRERGSIPSADLRFPSATLLDMASEELREGVAPLVHSAKAEHMVYTYSVAVTAGTATYRIPPRAIGGGGLRDVTWQYSGNNTQVSLREVPVSEVPMWGDATGNPSAYYVRNYSVVLLPTPNAAGTLYMPYYARPNALVATSACAIVTASSSSSVTVTAGTSVPLGTATAIDAIRGTPGFETLVSGLTVYVDGAGVVSGGNLTLYPQGVAVGDYLAPTGYSPVVQAPAELLGLLAVRTVRRALKSVGDSRWQDFDADVQELEARALQWLTPRNDGESKAVSPLNSGLLRGVMRNYVG